MKSAFKLCKSLKNKVRGSKKKRLDEEINKIRKVEVFRKINLKENIRERDIWNESLFGYNGHLHDELADGSVFSLSKIYKFKWTKYNIYTCCETQQMKYLDNSF